MYQKGMLDSLIKNDANINLIIQKNFASYILYKSQRSKLLKSLIDYGADLNFR